jgi:transcriptional regulator with XRE-family HTH domain
MSSPKPARNHFHLALRTVRLAKGMSQEDFSLVSSRTYVSSLERAQKSATLGKVDELADVMGVHPLTLLTLAYAEGGDPGKVDGVFSQVRFELDSLCGNDAKAQAAFVAGLSQLDAV